MSATPWGLIALVSFAAVVGVGFPLALLVACLKEDV